MPSDSHPARSARTWLFARLLLVLLIAGVAAAPWLQLRLIGHVDRGVWTDLYSPWVGARAALHGQDPYSPAVTRQIQQTIYGHVLQPGETWDRQAFVYPLSIALLLAPFTLLPWGAVHFIFGLFAPIAVALAVWAWMRVCDLRLNRPRTALLFALILTSWPAVWGYFQRQPSLYIEAAIAIGVLLLQKQRDIAAGILLALATVKPQMVALLAAWLLVQMALQRRWRFVGAFCLTCFLLTGAAMMLMPHWIPEWLHASAEYTRNPPKVPMLFFVLGRHLGETAGVALLLAVLFRLWKSGTIAAGQSEWAFPVALILAATVCLMPQNAWLVFNTLLMIPALFVVFGQRPAGPSGGLLQAIAGLALFLALMVTPICAVLGARLGFSWNLIMPPFLLNYLSPLPVTLALLLTKAAPAVEARNATGAVVAETAR